MRRLSDYAPIVGRSTIEEILWLGDQLSGKSLINVNSTAIGGGVAEILENMVPLARQVGVDAKWLVIEGSDEFFKVTKKFHNALHGRREEVTADDFELFRETSNKIVEETDIGGDIHMIHDPQPVALISRKGDLGGDWVWRCHIDVSHPDQQVWDFLREFVIGYDSAVFSAPSFAQQLPIRQALIHPSIDPLSDKNKELSLSIIDSVLTKYGVDGDKPIITQISRFDYLKDPVGVIQAFKIVKRSFDCQLVLAGGTAIDDPESEKVLEEVREAAAGMPDVHVLLVPPKSDIEINALQRASTIIVQKSLQEGFGLTVSEALWKGKPVVASAVGGIPLQIINQFTGRLSYDIEGTAYALRQLLAHPDYAKQLGEKGREHVRQNFLITRQLQDYLLLFLALHHPEDVLYL